MALPSSAMTSSASRCRSSAMWSGSTWPRSLSATANASAALVMTGGAGRSDHPLGEDRTRLRRVGFEVIVLDRRDQPAVWIVEERLEVRPAMRFSHFAGLCVFGRRDDGAVDGSKGADEIRPGNAQPDLRVLPRSVELLALQNVADRVADRDQLLDDPDMPFRNAVGASALAHHNGERARRRGSASGHGGYRGDSCPRVL